MQDNLASAIEELDQSTPQFNPFEEGYSKSKKTKTRESLVIRLKSQVPRNLLFTGIGTAMIVALITIVFLKTCLAIAPSYTKVDQVVNKPFIVHLNETLSSVPLNEIKITPAVDGTWSFKSGMLIGQDELIFTPKTYFKVDTNYAVTFGSAKRALFGSSAPITNVDFKTELAPSLTDAGTTGLKNSSTIAADYAFTVDLAAPNKGLRILELKTTPNVPMTLSVSADQKFTWTPTAGFLPQGVPVSFQVYDSKNNVTLATKTFDVAPEPTITTPVKSTEFGQSDVATITFSQPIDPASSKYITFSLPGTGKWQSSTVYAFTPLKVTPGQTYSYTIDAGLRTTSGGIFATKQTATFSTVGPVTVTSSSPHGTNLSQTSQQISFTFDQPVDHSSVLSHFSVSSGTIASTAWQGNTFTVTVTNLGYQLTVTATLAAGILNTGFGLPSTQVFSDSFTTAIRVLKLNIPYYTQQFSATCAAASLRMVLAYYGVTTDDMSIVDAMGYAPTVENKSTNPPTWDDPQEMFVGSVSGSISAGTSAGPDAPPVAKAAEAFGQSASAVTGIGVSWIAQQLYNNDPVIFFGAYSNTGFISWQTPSGRIETMNLTSHARVVTGVEGNPSNPIGFWVSDPIDGASYWTAAQVQASINLDAYQQAVVVY